MKSLLVSLGEIAAAFLVMVVVQVTIDAQKTAALSGSEPYISWPEMASN